MISSSAARNSVDDPAQVMDIKADLAGKAGQSDQPAADGRNPGDHRGVFFLQAAAVDHRPGRSPRLLQHDLLDHSGDKGDVFRAWGHLSRPDRPDRLVSDHDRLWQVSLDRSAGWRGAVSRSTAWMRGFCSLKLPSPRSAAVSPTQRSTFNPALRRIGLHREPGG